MGYIYVVQVRDKLQAVLNKVMNLWLLMQESTP